MGVNSCSAGVVDIIIPSIVSREGSVYTVTTIGAQPQTRAQFGDGLFSDTLKTIVLPETLITIGSGVFKECNNLSSINLEDCVCLIEIGIQAFDGCSSLKEVTIPKSVESIKTYAFSNCSGLTSISLPSSLKAIEGSAFNNCINLTEVIIDSEYVYTNATSASACGRLLENATTIKVLTSLLEAGENSYITTNFTKGPTEVIGGKNYTVYSK